MRVRRVVVVVVIVVASFLLVVVVSHVEEKVCARVCSLSSLSLSLSLVVVIPRVVVRFFSLLLLGLLGAHIFVFVFRVLKFKKIPSPLRLRLSARDIHHF